MPTAIARKCARLIGVLLAGSAVLSHTALSGDQRAARHCDEWNAVYASQPDDQDARVFAEFGKAEGSAPMPFTLAGVARSGTRAWQYKTVAWCFLGSGGCHIGLRKKGEAMEAAADRPLRITFVRSSKTDSKATPDILVLSGLAAEFLDNAKATGTQTLAIERLNGATGIVVPPDVFYFERCRTR